MTQAGTTRSGSPLRFGRLLGGVCLAAGTLLLAHRLLAVVVPSLRPAYPLPLYDRLHPWNGPFLFFGQFAAGLLLLVAGWAILRRSRWAPALFLVPGWGALLFFAAGARPGPRLEMHMRTAVSAARKFGLLAEDGTFWDLVPRGAVEGLLAFVALWLLLLVAGSVHFWRQRRGYDR